MTDDGNDLIFGTLLEPTPERSLDVVQSFRQVPRPRARFRCRPRRSIRWPPWRQETPRW